MLSDSELDDALAFLYRPADPTTDEWGSLRDRVTGAPPASRSRRSRGGRLLLAAAVVALLVAGGLLAPAWLGGPRVNPAAAAQLNTAADAVAGGADAVPAGMYRYVDTHAWFPRTTLSASAGSDAATYSVLVESRRQQWIPARWEDDWLERRSTTGAAVFVSGDEDAARTAGALSRPSSVEPDLIGPCQNYFDNLCTGTDGSWQTPTREWIDALPADPVAMFERLSSDAQGNGQSHEAEMLVLATDALRAGLLPASTKATLYRAMALIPGVEITDEQASLDGDTGVAFAVRGPETLDETIIDPASGAFIGERETAADGTVIGYTAVRSSIVGGLGQT